MVVATYHPRPMGGAEIQCERLSMTLAGKGCNVGVLTIGDGILAPEESVQGITVYRMYSAANRIPRIVSRWKKAIAGALHRPATSPPDKRGPAFDPTRSGILTTNVFAELIDYTAFLLNAMAFMAKHRRSYQVLHVHVVPWISFVGAVLGILFRKQVLVKESTTTGLLKFDDFPGGGFMKRVVTRKCWFIAMTREIESELLSCGVQPQRLFYVPNGIQIQTVGSRRRKPYHGLFVGNLTQGAAKGLDILLEAWSIVLRSVPGAVLDVAGRGDPSVYDPMVRSLSIDGSVIFHGSVVDPALLYQETGVFILPSRREGMSNALLEAMSYGCPIVSSAVSGSVDLLDDDVNGILVPVGDVTALAAAVTKIFSDHDAAEKLGQAARATVQSRCEFGHVADEYLQIYSTLSH